MSRKINKVRLVIRKLSLGHLKDTVCLRQKMKKYIFREQKLKNHIKYKNLKDHKNYKNLNSSLA